MQLIRFFLATLAVVHLLGAPCLADYFYFSTGGPDYRMAAASRWASWRMSDFKKAHL